MEKVKLWKLSVDLEDDLPLKASYNHTKLRLEIERFLERELLLKVKNLDLKEIKDEE